MDFQFIQREKNKRKENTFYLNKKKKKYTGQNSHGTTEFLTEEVTIPLSYHFQHGKSELNQCKGWSRCLIQ